MMTPHRDNRPDAAPICPLCGRPIPKHAKQSVHHLTPKLKGGAGGPTVLLHQICHATIHAHLTESELARDYNTIEALRAHPAIKSFIKWVAKKDPAFHAPTKGRRRGRRIR
ncbi:MAG: HNH endonuclease [Pseudomonadota bacterium]